MFIMMMMMMKGRMKYGEKSLNYYYDKLVCHKPIRESQIMAIK
jgi:hypothetical protein